MPDQTAGLRIRRCWQWLALAVVFGLFALPRSTLAYTPESPEVSAMVERGLLYLEKNTKIPEGAGLTDEAGELWLVALTLVKNGKDESHPLVAAAIRRAQLAARPNAVAPQGAIGIYAHALSVIFLCELNPAKHKAEISHLLAGLLRIQLPSGAWTYSGGGAADTSQTQYGILALWTADHAGFDVPTENIERACNWLLRTQDRYAQEIKRAAEVGQRLPRPNEGHRGGGRRHGFYQSRQPLQAPFSKKSKTLQTNTIGPPWWAKEHTGTTASTDGL